MIFLFSREVVDNQPIQQDRELIKSSPSRTSAAGLQQDECGRTSAVGRVRQTGDVHGPRVESASTDDLDAWAERLLTTISLDEVFQ